MRILLRGDAYISGTGRVKFPPLLDLSEFSAGGAGVGLFIFKGRSGEGKLFKLRVTGAHLTSGRSHAYTADC